MRLLDYIIIALLGLIAVTVVLVLLATVALAHANAYTIERLIHASTLLYTSF